jgi:16S rRNA (cytosine967-C5)-methyltransferase
VTLPEGEIPASEAWNLPDWLRAQMTEGLGDQAEATARLLQTRAPVTLRVNISKTDASGAILMLQASGVEAEINPLSATALTVVEGARRVRNAPAYQDGFVELQDAGSQALVDALPQAARVLDYCAGGGGKALAIAARGADAVFAHDIDPARMRDLPLRAARANAEITQLAGGDLARSGPYDLVLVDAPCSGSGSWRRAPEAKWNLTPDQLGKITQIQDDILDRSSELVSVDGTLAYATCSVLPAENRARVDAFLARHPGWHCTWEQTYPVSPQGDGFYTAHLTQKK